MIKVTKVPTKGDLRIITKFRIFPLEVEIVYENRKYSQKSGWFEKLNILQIYKGHYTYSYDTECKWVNIKLIEESKTRIEELNKMLNSTNIDDVNLALGMVNIKLV